MDQGAHVNVGRVIAEHFREEISLGDGGMAHDQLLRKHHFFFSGRLSLRPFPGRDVLGQGKDR